MPKYICLLILLCLVASTALAQEPTEEPTVIKQCITEFVEPPNNWTFDGTIFTYGNGLHAFRSDADSRYFVAFHDEYLASGAFSPDGQWFAHYVGYSRQNINCCSVAHYLTGIKILSTSLPRDVYTVPYSGYQYGISVTIYPPSWLSDNLLVIDGEDVINPSDGNINPLTLAQRQELDNAEFWLSKNLWISTLASRFKQTQSDLFATDSVQRTIHVTDLTTNTTYDTCLENHFAYAMSPAGDQIAVSGAEGGFVYIIDLKEWKGYRLDLAANHVVAWFADPNVED